MLFAEVESKCAAPVIPHRRIVIADDNRDLADSLAMLFELEGHQATSTYGGVHAIELARSLRPDFLLLDIAMPVMDGYAVARQIRRQFWGQQIRLVAISGFGDPQMRARALRAGFNYHLTKPVCLDTLDAILCAKGGYALIPSTRS